MNVLDDDLRALFEEKARGIQASPTVPPEVLARARRRQLRSALAAGSLVVALLAASVAGIATLLGGSTEVPLGPERHPYPPRTVTIQGLTTTAPEGWTLLDLWPAASYLLGDVTECSFTATATPVGGDGAVAPTTQPEQECTTRPAPLPAGIPVMQISDRDLGIAPVCGIQGDPLDVPRDAAVLHVVAFPHDRSTEGLEEACPAGAEIETFVRGDVTYATVVVVGPEAAADAAALVRDQANGLTGQGLPAVEAPAANGPGYVVAAGSSGGFAWRLEAGFNPPADIDALGIGGVLIVTDDHGSETMTSVRLPTDDPVLSRTDPLGDGFITWGAADPTVAAIEAMTGDGSAAPATLVGWPDPMQGFLVDATPLNGSLWWAVTPTQARHVVVTLADGTQELLEVEDFPEDR